MKPDRTTYEAWLLDRAEGNLTPEQEHALDAFLAAHPDLPVETGPWPRLIGEAEHFGDHTALHRSFPPDGLPDADRLDDFLAARLEGDLSAKQEKALDRFLYEHPEAARHAAAMNLAKVPMEPLDFTGRSHLEKHIPPVGLPDGHRLPDFLIARLEGDLTAEQAAALDRWLIGHPEARREQGLFAAARIPQEPMSFPGKQSLKKRDIPVLPLWTRWAAAASIALFLGMGWWLSRQDGNQGPGLAQHIQPVLPLHAPAQPQASGHQPPSVTNGTVVPIGRPTETAQPKEPKHQLHHSPIGTGQDPRNGASVQDDPLPPAQTPSVVQPAPIGPAVQAEPALAQDEPPQPAEAPIPANTLADAPVEHTAPAPKDGQTLGTYLANRLRNDVLKAPERPAKLDGDDLLAVADRAVGMLSNGKGGVHVQRDPARERIRFSLGRNFTVSASSGR